jgi:hypothetical protein
LGHTFFQAGEKVLLCLGMGLNALELNWTMNQKHLIGKDLINLYEMEIKCNDKHLHSMQMNITTPFDAHDVNDTC